MFKKYEIIFSENRLVADNSHEISCFIIFEKAAKFEIVVFCKLKVGLYGLSNQLESFI